MSSRTSGKAYPLSPILCRDSGVVRLPSAVKRIRFLAIVLSDLNVMSSISVACFSGSVYSTALGAYFTSHHLFRMRHASPARTLALRTLSVVALFQALCVWNNFSFHSPLTIRLKPVSPPFYLSFLVLQYGTLSR